MLWCNMKTYGTTAYWSNFKVFTLHIKILIVCTTCCDVMYLCSLLELTPKSTEQSPSSEANR